jgi:hypothetical protein
MNALVATGKELLIVEDVVKNMPRGPGGETELQLFFTGTWLSDEELAAIFHAEVLRAADPFSVAALNEAEPNFYETYQNATHWKNVDGQWCYLDVRERLGKPTVTVNCNHSQRPDRLWQNFWWYAGVKM